MSQTERLYRLKNMLDSGRCLGRVRLLAELGISAATLKRDIAHLRDRMNAPVIWDREQGGYRLDAAQTIVGTQYELPGLWLSADEIHALLTMEHINLTGDYLWHSSAKVGAGKFSALRAAIGA